MAKDTPLGKGIIKIEADLSALEKSLAEAKGKIQAEPNTAGIPVAGAGTKDFGVGSSRTGTVAGPSSAAGEQAKQQGQIAEAAKKTKEAFDGIEKASKEINTVGKDNLRLATEETQKQVEKEVKITRQIALARQLAQSFMAVMEGIDGYYRASFDVANDLGAIKDKFSVMNNLNIDATTKQIRATEIQRDTMLASVDQQTQKWQRYKDILDEIDTFFLGKPEEKGYLREIVQGRIDGAQTELDVINQSSKSKIEAIVAQKDEATRAAKEVVSAENDALRKKLDNADDVYAQLEDKREAAKKAVDKRIEATDDAELKRSLETTKSLIDEEFDAEINKLNEIDKAKKDKQAERDADASQRILYDNERKRIGLIKDEKQRAIAELAVEEGIVNDQIAKAETDAMKDALRDRLKVLKEEFTQTIQSVSDEMMRKQQQQIAELRSSINSMFNTGQLEVGMNRVAGLIQVLIDKTGR